MHQHVEFTIKGISPLMLHNGQLANPLNPHAKRIKEFTSKRKKSDSDYEAIADIEWEGGLYLDDSNKIVMPGENIEAAMVEGGKKNRLGDAFKAGLLCDGKWPLKYDGPRDVARLKADPKFRDMRNVSVNNSKVIRCRPIFPTWGLTFTLSYLPDILNLSQVEQALAIVGRIIGLGDYTPKYGRFVVEG